MPLPVEGFEQPELQTGLRTMVEQPQANVIAQPVQKKSALDFLEGIYNKLTGSNGENRYQLWPERLVREGFTAPGNVLAKTEPSTTESLVEPAMQTSALAMTGGLGNLYSLNDAILGSGPIFKSKFKLEKIPSEKLPFKQGENDALFNIKSSNGKELGKIGLQIQDEGKSLYINNIQTDKGSNSLGGKTLTDFINQIKTHYPDIERIGGFRTSGARNKPEELWINLK